MATSTKSTSVLTGGANSKLTTAAELNALGSDFITPGVVGAIANTNGAAPATGGFAVNAHGSPDMGVAISSGQIYITTTPTGQSSQLLRTNSASTEDIVIANNTSGATKFDWIYAANSATNANTPDTPGITITSFVVSRSSNSSTDDGGNTPTYGKLLAIVQVINNAVSITNGNIADRRTQASLSAPNVSAASTNGFNLLTSNTFTYLSSNGGKEYSVTTPGDVTGTLYAGMVMGFDRAVAPSTQCMAFSLVSSQTATKTTPAGQTATAARTAEAWVYLNSQPNGVQGIITQSDQTTSGFNLRVDATGVFGIQWFGSSVNRYYASYESLPARRWVHIAGAATFASNTVTAYLNGRSLGLNPVSVAGTGYTASTANFYLGSVNGSSFFDGYISEARVWSSQQSQAQIQANMNIALVGNEANLTALWHGNGNFNDSTANANNLTAVNGAIATQAANPFNNTEYGQVVKATFGGGITTVLLSTGETCNIPNLGLNNPRFSTARQPYGVPADLTTLIGKRLVAVNILSAQNVTTLATFFPLNGIPFTVPANVTKIRLRGYSASVATPGTGAFVFYNGSIIAANNIAQSNITTTNGEFSVDIPISVIPGQSMVLNTQWSSTTGTFGWGAGGLGTQQEQGFWVEVMA